MKIVHICLASFFPDNYSYQENMLPKYHKKQGHDVEVIASLLTFDENGKTAYYKEPKQYVNENGIKVTRLAYRKPNRFYKKLRRYIGLMQALENASPDILFIHGCQFLDITIVVAYLKKHTRTKVFVDNHADFSNSATNFLSKNILHKIIWKRCAHKIEPFVSKFYGVLPARVDFLKNIYGLPPSKCELLVMGADDEMVCRAKNPTVRETVRKQCGIAEDEFLIVTGGKINHNRPETLELMQAVVNLNNPKVKLLIFGNVSTALENWFNELVKDSHIVFVGWIKSADTYKYFAAADLVVFPGLHSVLWEQAVAQGKPCVFKKIEGFNHVDVGGNAVFIADTSASGLQNSIAMLLSDWNRLEAMRKCAQEKGMKIFSYFEIARRSLMHTQEFGDEHHVTVSKTYK